MRFTDFLKTTVLLTAGEATALAAVTILAAAGKDDTVTIIFSLAWWAVAAVIGAWLGRRARPSMRIANLLTEASTSQALPEIRPQAVLVNRLWRCLREIRKNRGFADASLTKRGCKSSVQRTERGHGRPVKAVIRRRI